MIHLPNELYSFGYFGHDKFYKTSVCYEEYCLKNLYSAFEYWCPMDELFQHVFGIAYVPLA